MTGGGAGPLSIIVLGPGALGGALGRLLERGGARVAFIGRDGPRPVDGPYDGALVCVKSYQTRAAVRALEGLLAESGFCVSLQNGLGNVEAIAEALGAERAAGGYTTHAARRLPDGRAVHVAEGDTVIAPLVPDRAGALEALARALTGCGLAVRVEPPLARLLWGKLAVSCTVNPLTALLGATNGAVDRLEAARVLTRAVAEELEAVARAEGAALEGSAERALEVARRTAANRSSMLQDLEAGRRTEVEEVTGALVARADARGLPVPVNRTILALLRAREALALEGAGGAPR